METFSLMGHWNFSKFVETKFAVLIYHDQTIIVLCIVIVIVNIEI